MHADRYLKAVLTVIALELGWIAIGQVATPVGAQQAATPVVITGINLGGQGAYLPVGVLGQVREVPDRLVGAFDPLDARVRNERLNVSVQTPLEVRTVAPIVVSTDRSRPLWVENVGYTPSQRPGE